MLTEAEIKQIQDRKAARRRADEETNVIGGHSHNCRTCFHYETRNCDGLSNLGKICEHWYSPKSEIQGLAYWRQEVGLKNNRVVSAVGDFFTGRKRSKVSDIGSRGWRRMDERDLTNTKHRKRKAK